MFAGNKLTPYALPDKNLNLDPEQVDLSEADDLSFGKAINRDYQNEPVALTSNAGTFMLQDYNEEPVASISNAGTFIPQWSFSPVGRKRGKRSIMRLEEIEIWRFIQLKRKMKKRNTSCVWQKQKFNRISSGQQRRRKE